MIQLHSEGELRMFGTLLNDAQGHSDWVFGATWITDRVLATGAHWACCTSSVPAGV